MARDREVGHLVAAAGGAAGLVAAGFAVAGGFGPVRVALWFGVLVVFGELLRVNLPGDRDASPISGAAAVGYSLLTTLGSGQPAGHRASTVVAVVSAGTALGALGHVAVARDPRIVDAARRVLSTAVAALTFRLWLSGSVFDVTVGRSRQPILAMGLAVVLGVLADLLIGTVVTSARQRAPFAATLRNETAAQAALTAATAATGILIALSVPIMGLSALLVFSVPLLVTQFSFRRFASISGTYRQTIRALSRVTEVGGYVEPGHSRRVMNLAIAVGREFGLTDADMLDLEYAALMHDIGQLSLPDLIPRGSTLTVPPSERTRIAELGAAVIRSTGTLDRVAHIVEVQASPYRRMRENADGDVPLAARIVKACSAFDDLVSASRHHSGNRSAWDALERLRMGMAFEYDPRVVEALTGVLERSGQLW